MDTRRSMLGIFILLGSVLCLLPLFMFLDPTPKSMDLMVQKYLIVAGIQSVGCICFVIAYYINREIEQNDDKRNRDNKKQ